MFNPVETNVHGAQITIEEDGTCNITLKLDENGPLSSTGKSVLLYSSHGWVKLGNGCNINLGIVQPVKNRR